MGYPIWSRRGKSDAAMRCLLLYKERAREAHDSRRLRKTLASTLPLPPDLGKIVKEKSQGATPGHCTLRLPNFARCDAATSHLATLSCRTLRHRAIAPCHFRLSHPATQKPRFCPSNHTHSPPCDAHYKGARARGPRLSETPQDFGGQVAFSSLDKSNIPDILTPPCICATIVV